MEEFKEKDDGVSLEKHDGDEHHDEIEVNNNPPHNNEFQLHDAKPETVFIQDKDFKSGPDPEDCSARTEPSIRKEQMYNLEVDGESNHRTTFECSKEFSGKNNCNAPCLAIVSSYQDLTLAKHVTPTNISSASTSRPTKGVLSMNVTRRSKNGKVESHHRDWVGKVSSTRNGVSKMEKGKEPIICDADDSRTSSNMREDAQEDIECTSSRGMVSTVKRARIHDSESEKLIRGKRLKRMSDDNYSFMNWVTTITNGLTKPHGAPMKMFQHPSQHMKGVISPPSILDKEREYIGVSHGTRGFRSIFQSMYHPGYNVSNNKIKYLDHQKEADALKGTVGEKASNIGCCVLPDRLNFGQDGAKDKISTGPVINFGAYGIAPRENGIELHAKVLDSSKRFNKDVSQVENSSSAAMDNSAELMTQSRHVSQNSLWIIRHSRGVSSPQPKSIQHSNCLDLSTQKLQNDLVHKLPYKMLNEKPQHNSVSHIDSHGSERIVTDDCESKLQLTESSNYCKRSEPMTSCFVQRLDALKHTKPLKITEDTRMNKICLFCGMSDHSIRECSKVVETKLDQYLKYISLYDGIKKASCFCILCFQLDHWAASCPNASSKGNHISFKANSFSDVNFKSTAEKEHGNHPFITYDGEIMLWSESKKGHHQVLRGGTVSQRENEATETDFVVCAKDRSLKTESVGCGAIDLHMNRVEDTTNIDKMKMITSCSLEDELKRSEFKAFCSHLPATDMNEPKGIFVTVRKLRLSRLDILRWMKSRTPEYDLRGFFLRLRIGKLEKSLGSTCYHVACINGASCQSSISVCVGSSTYSVTSRFISNQDFDEDELKAWWLKQSRDGSKMPSSEELNEKLQLRLKFGF